MTTTVRLGVFTPSVLLDVARESGALREAHLEVAQTLVSSSPAQFDALAGGAYDAVFTSPDNVVAYRFLPANPLERIIDVEIIRVLDRGLGLSLAVRPGMERPTDRTRPLFAVDVPRSGFAFVGYALMERAGLAPGDYDIVALGSTPKRAAALVAGECDATILGAGNEVKAAAEGARLVSDVTDLGPYFGTVLARLRTGTGDRAAVDALAAVLHDTAARIVSGELAESASRSAARLLGLDAPGAQSHVAVLRDPARGLVREEGVDPAGFATLLELRRRYLPDPALDEVDLAALLP